jgi:hypothetical protein
MLISNRSKNVALRLPITGQELNRNFSQPGSRKRLILKPRLNVENYKVEQIAVFLENAFDRMADITSLLAENGINIRSLSLADTAAYAILRLIVNDVDNTKQILKEAGFTIGENDVLIIKVPDRPGGTASVLQTIKKHGLNIEYMYAFAQGGESALIIFRFADPDEAISTLSKAGLRLLTREEAYAL